MLTAQNFGKHCHFGAVAGSTGTLRYQSQRMHPRDQARRQCCVAGRIKSPGAAPDAAVELEVGSSATTDSGGKVNVTFRPALVMPPGSAPT